DVDATQDGPGLYAIIHEGTFLSGSVAVPADKDVLQILPAGTEVWVLEVVLREEESRVRGRIGSPAGWISLLDTKTGYRWAERRAPAAPAAKSEVIEPQAICVSVEMAEDGVE
ncbi:unnamed protein product, partial [Polarella glacialis]